jgi:hypothetical protein
VHPGLDNIKEIDIVHDAVQASKRPVALVIEDVQVDFKGIAGRQLLFKDTMTSGENEFM